MNIVLMLVLWLAEKLAEKALDKVIDKILSEGNLNSLITTVKLQVLVLYLDWVLEKTHVQDIATQLQELGK